MAEHHPDDVALLAQSKRQAKPLERFVSNPTRHFMGSAKKISRRTKTAPSEMLTDVMDAHVYGERLFKRLLRGLEASNLANVHLRSASYTWLIPQESATTEDLLTFDQLYTAAPTVTHAQLAEIFTMEISTSTSPLGIQDHHYFYIRELVLDSSQLGALLGYMRDSDNMHEESSVWADMLKLYGVSGESGCDCWTLRYVGTVKGPGRPIDRLTEDPNSPLASFLGETYRALEQICPEVIRDARTYLLPQATVAYTPSSNAADRERLLIESASKAEDTERLLIELFHHSSLLNRQRGGIHSSFVPDAEDAERFASLQTDAWETSRAESSSASTELEVDLSSHFEARQTYINDYPGETGASSYAYTDAHRERDYQQALPSQYRGMTVGVFIGKDVTYSDYTNSQNFWNGNSPAGELTKSMLRRITSAEAESHDRGHVREISEHRSLWCFVDLWPWLWHKNQEQAATFLKDYLGITRPLIAVSYSHPVNSLTRADFLHSSGVGTSGASPLTEIVGLATIQYYNSPGESRDECAFINIPQIDPGRDKYGKQNVRLRRFLELSMQEAFVYFDLALKTLDKHSGDKISRLELCKEILNQRNIMRESKAHKQFLEGFENARAQCKQLFADASRSSNDDVRPILDAAGRLKLLELGRAEGFPNSSERDQQLERLWELHIPDLHIHIEHSLANKQRWFDSFLPLQTGQYLYLSALAECEPDSYVENLLQTFAPEGSGRLWMHDKRQRSQAAISAGVWVTRKMAKDGDEEKQPHVHYPMAYLPASQLQGSPIGIVQSSGIATIRWLKNVHIRLSIRISCRIAIPADKRQTRILYFTPEGLDILDTSGEALRLVDRLGQSVPATIPRIQFADKPDLIDLWREVLQAEGIDVPVDADEPVIDWGQKGVPALTQKAQRIHPAQNRPVPDRGDANYILYKFLEEPDFRNGGDFQAAFTDDLPDSRAHITRFVEFLQGGQWAGHPYRDWWLGNFNRPQPEMSILSKNIPLLRSCSRQVTKIYSATRKGKVHKKSNPSGRLVVDSVVLRIGPPGSAFEDPFDEAHGQSAVAKKRAKAKKGKADQEEEEVEEEAVFTEEDEYEESVSAQGKRKASASAALQKPSKRRATRGGTR